MAGSLFAHAAQVGFTHIPYRGGAPAVTDLVAGKIDFIMSPLIEVLAQVQAGRLRAIAVTTLRRTPALPQIPTIAETLPGFEIALWNGLMAPTATPPAAVTRIAAEVAAALRAPALRAQLLDQGCEPVGSSPEDFARFIHTEIPRWTEIVRISGASAD
jgi:tripartite-type tricarboxylate transporter receptor subunit TctC